jgi:uncharacterized protein
MKKLYFEINQITNKPLKADLYLSENDAKTEINPILKPINIIIHGFKGFRTWGFIPTLAKEIAQEVGPSIAIDFSLDGTEDKSGEIYYNNDDFRRNTISQMLLEIKSLLDFIQNGEFSDEFNCKFNGKINLIGHSMGGALSIITAFEDQGISKICLWATPQKLIWNTDRQKTEWREKGFMEIKIQSTGQILNLDVGYLEDKENNLQRFDLLQSISSLEIPICIIHGKQDFTVRLHSAEELRDAASDNENMEYHIIEKCNHVFNTSHPFSEIKKPLSESISYTINFLNS